MFNRRRRIYFPLPPFSLSVFLSVPLCLMLAAHTLCIMNDWQFSSSWRLWLLIMIMILPSPLCFVYCYSCSSWSWLSCLCFRMKNLPGKSPCILSYNYNNDNQSIFHDFLLEYKYMSIVLGIYFYYQITRFFQEAIIIIIVFLLYWCFSILSWDIDGLKRTTNWPTIQPTYLPKPSIVIIDI